VEFKCYFGRNEEFAAGGEVVYNFFFVLYRHKCAESGNGNVVELGAAFADDESEAVGKRVDIGRRVSGELAQMFSELFIIHVEQF